MGKTTQTQRVMRYLKDFGSISSHEAFTELGIVRLASRICELRQDGHPIKDKWEHSVNRYGDKVQFKRYWLDQPEQTSFI